MIGIELGLHLGSNVPTLLHQALSAIRRNNGTLIGIPDSFAGAYIESDGTRPVTAVGDVLGLLTDRSYGAGNLGANLVTTTDFTKPDWTTVGSLSTVTPNSFTNTSGGGAGKAFAAGLSTAKLYSFSVAYTKSDASTLFGVYASNGSFPIATATAASGVIEVNTYPGANGLLYLRLGGNATVTITSISVREVLGQHATQPTTASKPTVTRVPKRLGPNLVVNGAFDSDTSGWGANNGGAISVSGGELTVTNSIASSGRGYQMIPTEANKPYLMTSFARAGTASAIMGWGTLAGSSAGGSVLTASAQLLQLTFVATAASTSVTLQTNTATAGHTAIFDNIEVREVLEWTNAISFDGSNDFLALGSVPFQMTDDHCIIAGATTNDFLAVRSLFGAANASSVNSRIQLYTAQTSGSLLGMWRDDANTANAVSFASAAIGVPYVATIRKVGSQLAGRKDGGAWTTGTATVGTTTLTRADVGGASPLNSPGGFHAGPITAVVLLKGNVPDADILLIEKWIGSLQGQSL